MRTLFESVVYIQQGKMIAVDVRETSLCLVSRFLRFRWAHKTLWH